LLASKAPTEQKSPLKLLAEKVKGFELFQYHGFVTHSVCAYRPPIPGHFYAIGVDTAEGKIRESKNDLSALVAKELPDFSVACVLDCDTNEQVFVYASLESPLAFAEKVHAIHRAYNEGVLVVEINGPGLAVHLKLEDMKVSNFYTREVQDKTDRTWTRKKGFRTTVQERFNLIEDLRQSLHEEDGVIVLDRSTWNEMRAFQYATSGKAEANQGSKDDRVFGARGS